MIFIKLIFITIWIFLLILFILGVIAQMLMIHNRKPGVNLFDRRLLFNPFNIEFFGRKYLTKKGIYWRNKSWLYFGIFVFIILLLFSAKLFLP